MTLRVLWTEIRRGPAALAGLLTAPAGLLIVQAEPIGARWMSLASSVQYSLFLVVPLAMAVAVWHGGREHRRRLGESLEGMPRRPAITVVVRWAGLTAGPFAGLLVVVGFGAVQVAPRASYWGGGWWWVLGAAFACLAAVTALGMMVGRLLPYRALAPLIAIGTYAVLVFILDGLPVRLASVSDEATTMFQRSAALVPLRRTMDLDGMLVPVRHGLSMMAWLVALTAAALAVLAARRVVTRLAVWGLPLVAAWYLGFHGNVVAHDASALEPVCAPEQPEVCVARMNAYALPEATTVAQKLMADWAGVAGGSIVARDHLINAGASHVVPSIGLYQAGDEWHGDVLLWPSCQEWSAGADRAAMVAFEWWAMSNDQLTEIDHVDPLVLTFATLDEPVQQDWIGQYIDAARTCDVDGLAALAEELE